MINKGKNSPVVIAVIGGSACSREEGEMAEAVGREIARRDAVLICGGLTGVMEAACRGARAEGGLTIGILPGVDGREANPYVDIPVASGVGYARNLAVVKSARAVIAVGGSYGTLSEIAYALADGIPVIGINTWSLRRDGKEVNEIIQADSAEDAVGKAISLKRR